MHEIQTQILKQLTLSEKARYSSIKPPKTGGNQFVYHLKELLNDSMIKKDGIFYSLTSKGERFADGISLKTFTKRIQPKIVTMIYIKNDAGEIIFCKRSKQPFIEKLCLPYGKIHVGERIEESAEREIFEKTGIKTENIKHRGDIYLAIYKEDEPISHMLCHLFEAQLGCPTSKLETNNNYFWELPEKLDFKRCIPGTKEILALLKKEKGHFFKEIFVEV